MACAVVGSAEPVVVGNIAAAAAGGDDGHSSCVGAAVRNAFDGAHIWRHRELDVPDAAAAASLRRRCGRCCCAVSCAATQTRVATNTAAQVFLAIVNVWILNFSTVVLRPRAHWW